MMNEQDIPLTRASRCAGVPRRTLYNKPKRRTTTIDEEIAEVVKRIAAERTTYGYRRVTAMVRRELDRPVNTKAVRRVMKHLGLLLAPPKHHGRRSVKSKGTQIVKTPNTQWSMDMSWLWCGKDGRGFLFAVVDCCTGECVGYVFARRCRTEEALACLEKALQERFPDALAHGLRLRTDRGSCFTSRRFTAATVVLGVEHELSAVNCPESNGVAESFFGHFKRDYVWPFEFSSFEEAEAHVARGMWDYNHVRPHSRLKYRAPADYAKEVMEGVKKIEVDPVPS
jgi:putative transposase